jgi:hypothetical protein
MRGVAVVAFIAFLVIVGALVAMCRAWRQAAEHERVEAVLRHEIERLED